MRMSQKRGESGRFVETITHDDVFAVLDERDEPVTGKEVGGALDISNRSALDKLNELHARGRVARKKVGGGAVVWWLTDEERARGGSPDALFGLAGLFGDDEEAAARARERSAEWGEAFDEQLMSGVEDTDTTNAARDA